MCILTSHWYCLHYPGAFSSICILYAFNKFWARKSMTSGIKLPGLYSGSIIINWVTLSKLLHCSLCLNFCNYKVEMIMAHASWGWVVKIKSRYLCRLLSIAEGLALSIHSVHVIYVVISLFQTPSYSKRDVCFTSSEEPGLLNYSPQSYVLFMKI